MAQNSKIEWTQKTWNPVTGCTKVSQGCKNCYAETFANRKMGEWGKIGEFMKFTPGSKEPYVTRRCREFTDVVCHPDRLNQPLKWRKPAKVFVNSMSDLFHEDVPFEFILKVYDIMLRASVKGHIFQILTKRPERAVEFYKHFYASTSRVEYGGGESMIEFSLDNLDATDPDGDPFCGVNEWPLKNVWIGVSVEDQKTADERIPLLLQIPAAVRLI